MEKRTNVTLADIDLLSRGELVLIVKRAWQELLEDNGAEFIGASLQEGVEQAIARVAP